MVSVAPISIIRTEQSLVLQGGAPARIEIAHEGGTEIIIERSDIPGPPREGAANGGDKIDVINPVAGGQVQFMLSAPPSSPALVRMIINGTRYRPPDFLVAGQAITWGSPFSLTPNDEIEFSYPV